MSIHGKPLHPLTMLFPNPTTFAVKQRGVARNNLVTFIAHEVVLAPEQIELILYICSVHHIHHSPSYLRLQSIPNKKIFGASCVSLSLSPRPRTKAGSSCWNCWRPSLCRVAVVPRPHGHASPWPPWPPSPPWRPWPLPSGPPD